MQNILIAVRQEATNRRDVLLSEVSLGHNAVGLVLHSFVDETDVPIDLCMEVETVLTRARQLELHARRAPSADASNLAEATMRHTRLTRVTPTRNHACEALALRCANDVDNLVCAPRLC